MRLQRQPDGSASPRLAPQSVDAVLSSPGERLAAPVRAELEAGFGRDLSGVRIHRDGRGGESARAVNAAAYTVGNHIVFGAGRYAPETVTGKRLLAHELAHVVQQDGAERDVGNVPRRQSTEEGAACACQTDDDESDANPPPTKRPVAPSLQREVLVNRPYPLRADVDPIAGERIGIPLVGICNPILNGQPQSQLQSPSFHPDKFLQALRLPTLAQLDLDQIPRPDLSDGSLDPVRANLVELSRKKNRFGRRVQLVQEALVAWGKGLDEPLDLLPQFGADGDFGGETEEAVFTFQGRTPGLVEDGVVGDLTFSALEREMADLHGFKFTVDTVPDNVFSGLVQVPAPAASWSTFNAVPAVLKQREVKHPELPPRWLNRFLSSDYDENCPMDATATVSGTVKGDINAAVETHERGHERQQIFRIQELVKPWDVRLRQLEIHIRAQNVEEASERVFQLAGAADPCELANSVVHRWQEDNAAFHATREAGAKVFLADAAESGCGRLLLVYSPGGDRTLNGKLPVLPSCTSGVPPLAVTRVIQP